MFDWKKILAARTTENKTFALIQIDDSVIKHCDEGMFDSLISDLINIVTNGWWASGYQLKNPESPRVFGPRVVVLLPSSGWFFNSSKELTCEVKVQNSFDGRFIFLWKQEVPRLFYIDDDENDHPALVTSPRRPPVKEDGAMVKLPD